MTVFINYAELKSKLSSQRNLAILPINISQDVLAMSLVAFSFRAPDKFFQAFILFGYYYFSGDIAIVWILLGSCRIDNSLIPYIFGIIILTLIALVIHLLYKRLHRIADKIAFENRLKYDIKATNPKPKYCLPSCWTYVILE